MCNIRDLGINFYGEKNKGLHFLGVRYRHLQAAALILLSISKPKASELTNMYKDPSDISLLLLWTSL
jgi:hypothetical protein